MRAASRVLLTSVAVWFGVVAFHGTEPNPGADKDTDATYRFRCKLAGVIGNGHSLAVSEDGKRYAVSRAEPGKAPTGFGFFHIGDLKVGSQPTKMQSRDTRLFPFGLSPDGLRLATTSLGRNVVVREITTGKVIHTFHGAGGTVFAIAFSPDGRFLAETSHDSVNIWDLLTGRKVHEFEEDGRFCAVAFSPDGNLLAAGAVEADQPIYAWNLVTGKPLAPFGGIAAPRVPKDQAGQQADRSYRLTVGFTTNGDRVFLSGKDAVAFGLWEADSGRLLYRNNHVSALVPDAVFAPDGRTVLAPTIGSVRLWDVFTGKERGSLGNSTGASHLAFINNGQVLVGWNENGVWLWDIVPETLPAEAKLTDEELGTFWTELRTNDPRLALRARNRILASRNTAVAYLSKQLRPTPPLDPQRVGRLIQDLDSKNFTARQRATDELQKLGAMADDALRQALAKKPPLEVRRRVEQIRGNQLAPFPTNDPDLLQTLRGIEVLEQIGTAEVRPVLEKLAGGATRAWPTEQAKAALRRLARKGR